MMNLISKSEALDLVRGAFARKAGTELVDVFESYGRCASQEIYAENTIPVVRSSGGDGIAVRSEDFNGKIPDTSGWKLGVDYVRADTGDDFDDQFDAVIMIENVVINPDGSVQITPEAASQVVEGMEVMPKGSTVLKNELVVPSGRIITASDMAAMITAGVRQVPVYNKPKVSFIPTGSELIGAGCTPERGQNVDCNSTLVSKLLEEYGAQVTCWSIVRDDVEMLEQAMDEALSDSDIVIINGGSSKGEEDFNTKLMASRGNLLFHRVAAGPGMPMAAAIVGSSLVINLPGPTIGAFYCMEWFVKEIIAGMMNRHPEKRPVVEALLAEDVMTPAFMEFQCRVNLQPYENGGYRAYPLTFDNSRNMTRITSDGAFLSPVGVDKIEKGTKIKVELYRKL